MLTLFFVRSKPLIRPMLAVVLILSSIFFITKIMDVAVAIDQIVRPTVVDTRQETVVADHKFPEQAPVKLGALTPEKNAYFRMRLRFRVHSTDGIPNLFQTGPDNSGVRLEISGDTAGIIIRDRSITSQVRGFTIINKLEINRWYLLDIELQNGKYFHAMIDAKPVANLADKKLSLDLSDIRIGSGFNETRLFHGDVADIWISKGQLDPSLSKISVLIAVSIPALLFWLSVICTVSIIPPENQKKKIALKLVALSAPLLCFLTYIEFRLFSLENSYLEKRVSFERQIDKIQTLILGSSNSLYGIDPSAFSSYGYNLSFLGSRMIYDARLVEKYAKRMPALQTVIFNINYETLGTEDRFYQQSWRRHFLHQFMGIAAPDETKWTDNLMFWLDPINFSKIALYGKDIFAYYSGGFGDLIDVVLERNGLFNAGLARLDPSLGFGLNAHNHDITNIEMYSKQLSLIENAVDLLKKRHVRVAIVLAPLDKSFYEYIEPEKITRMHEVLASFAKKHDVIVRDYTTVASFDSGDTTWEMADHLNKRGAYKFAALLEKDILSH